MKALGGAKPTLPVQSGEAGVEARFSSLVIPPGLFRIVLALLVMINHTMPVKFGALAVYLFFMLSGYWCYRMWFSEYRATRSPYLVFIASRAWRLLPVYLVAMVLLTLFAIMTHEASLLPADASALHRLHFYFSNFAILGLTRLPDTERVLYPAWSLDIEMQFYLIVPLIIVALHSARAKLWAAGILGMALVFSAVLLVFYEGDAALSGYLPMYLTFFLIGVFTARLNWVPESPLVLTSLALSALFVLACFAFHSTRGLFMTGSLNSAIGFYRPAGCFVLALLLAPYAMATVSAKPRGTFMTKFDRDLSNLTYEVYLLHVFVLDFVAYCFPQIGHYSHYKQIPFMLGVYTTVAVFSWGVYRWIDRPIDAARRAFVKSRRRAAGTSEAPALSGLDPALAPENAISSG